MLYFTSDPHIGHRLVAGLRGFDDADDHDAALADNWDSMINKDDDVWVLGDISAGGASSQVNALDWFSRRPGRKHLITGNHDGCHPLHRDAHKWQPRYLEQFLSVQPFARRRILSHQVLLSHFPYQGDGDGDYSEERFTQYRLPDKGEWLLHGHIHSAQLVRGKSIHVGLDAHGLKPVSLSRVEQIILRQLRPACESGDPA